MEFNDRLKEILLNCLNESFYFHKDGSLSERPSDKSFRCSKPCCERTEKFEKHDIDSQLYKERIRNGNYTT
jgi:hypothetical protein